MYDVDGIPTTLDSFVLVAVLASISLTELIVDDPCVLFALAREAQPFCREFRPQQRFHSAPCRARFCGPEWLSVLVLETGIGPQAAGNAVSWLLSRPALEQVPYRPKVVIAAGFAGALQDGLAIGDVILATEVMDDVGQSWPATWPGELPPGDWKPPLRRGRVLTVPRLVGKAEDKKSLGAQQAALAVDMESATVAHLCSQQGIPFGCVRVISDDVNTTLSPALVPLMAGGAISPLRLAQTLTKTPSIVGELWRLARVTRMAAIQLQKALGQLLTLTLPWGKELNAAAITNTRTPASALSQLSLSFAIIFCLCIVPRYWLWEWVLSAPSPSRFSACLLPTAFELRVEVPEDGRRIRCTPPSPARCSRSSRVLGERAAVVLCAWHDGLLHPASSSKPSVPPRRLFWR